MSKCVNHPGRDAAVTIDSRGYCTSCQQGISGAVTQVNRHVVPPDCFVWYVSNNNWQPITGTGCAHWVAHQRNIRRGGANEKCLAGFPYRVRTVIQGVTEVQLANVQVNDIYATPSRDHMGLVHSITGTGASRRIVIRHDSSAQGGVSDNEFATYFHGQGSFFR